MKILITSGGTEEPIDGVRYITNFSTGKTGAVLADRMKELGASVTLLHGHRACRPEGAVERDSFTTFRSLDEKLKDHLSTGNFDAVIHLAAVSDYSVDYIETAEGSRREPDDRGKISSDSDELILHLKRNHKILQRLKEYSRKKGDTLVVGFKLTDTDSMEEMERAVQKQLAGGHVDLVVHNNLRNISQTKHPARIYASNGDLLCRTEIKEELADKLFHLLQSATSPGAETESLPKRRNKL